MPDINQPELPEPDLRVECAQSFVDGWTAEKLHAHYAKGREDERVERAEEIAAKADRIEQLENDLLAALKQSLAQPAQAAVLEGWKLVPVDLTEEMAEALDYNTWPNTSGEKPPMQQAWSAVLNVAPEREGGA